MSLFGYHGQYLKIDPRPGRSGLMPIDSTVLRQFLGGVGLGTWLVAHETPAGADPLGEDNALVFAFSPLVGTPLTTSAKFAVVAIGPLTGRLCDALSSSHFAIAAKRTGVDAIVINGKFSASTILIVDGLGGPPKVEIRPAGDLWGLPARECEDRLRAQLGPEYQIAAIGPAGERLIPFATISHDGRHAGRGGLGAVLGSKNVKAIAVRGDHRVPVANSDRVIQIAKDLSARSFGPATEKYRELGTVANLLVFNRFNALPTRNFSSGQFETVEKLTSEDLAPARRVARNSCAACTIGCEHIYASQSKAGTRLEYESLYALGPLCGVDDGAAVLEAARACDEAGIDTISTGATIAFLMDCADRGLLSDARLPSGRLLKFGDGAAVAEAIKALVAGEGLGQLLRLGSRRAAEQIGGEAPGLACHVKGLELPGYHPKALHTMALGLSVGTRGADHNRSGAYEADFSAGVDRKAGSAASALAAISTEDRAALIDALILCKFLRGIFSDLFAESAEMLNAVTGWDYSADELREVATRIVTARKLINQREGWTTSEDTLPPRLRPAPLALMIEAYYHQRGWDFEGRVPTEMNVRLGLTDPVWHGL